MTDQDVTAEFDDDGPLGSPQALRAWAAEQLVHRLAQDAEEAESVEDDGLPLPEGTTVTRGFPLGTRIQTERRSSDNKFTVLTTTYRTSLTLADFLLARIAEDEAAARYCTPMFGVAVTAHIARHDPARVLAEVEAKRRIVEMQARHAAFEKKHDADDAGWVAQGLFDAMVALAHVYSDHPDYRAEWAA